MNTGWSKKYDCLIRISRKNRDRIKLARGTLNLANKLDEILNLYFENGGGRKERKKIERSLNKLYGQRNLQTESPGTDGEAIETLREDTS